MFLRIGGKKMVFRRATSITKVLSVMMIAVFLPSILWCSTPSYSETPLLLPHKGMCYVTWEKERFASQYSDESLKKLSSLGVEYVSICVTHYQEKYNSTSIKRTERTPSDKSLKHVIKESHKLGLKVMLKPHVDLIDKFDGTYWRGDIGFAREEDWQAWFKEYQDLIIHYARMCEKLDVEIFCVGTELSFTTQKDPEWRKIIAETRKVYSGKIVYAANWDNFKNVGFWQDLDYVGIDAYFPLTYKSEPSLEDLKRGWEKWVHEIEAWQGRVNKPIIFTEIGYSSTPHAPYEP